MRLVLFGTGPFAVPTYEALIKSHDVAALVTRPITDGGKRRKTAENPTRDLGESHGLTILDPLSCNDAAFVETLKAMQAELFIVCDYGQIMSRECLAAAKLGGINLHGSLLPKYRGAAPIQWCVYNGDTTTGVTVIHMTPRLDGGPCIVKESLEILPDETSEQLEPRLSLLGPAAVEKAIEMLRGWDGESTLGELQPPEHVTKAPRLKKADGQIDFARTARQVHNQVRAFQPWPKSFTNWSAQNGKSLRLIVSRTRVIGIDELNDVGHADVPAGAVVLSDDRRLWVRTGDAAISILEIQPAGKRPMPIADFLRGHRPSVGDLFE